MSLYFSATVPERVPVATFSVFRFPWSTARWALRQMARPFPNLPGLRFGRRLGSGYGGFSLLPSLRTYSILTVWQNMAAAVAYIDSDAYGAYAERAAEANTLLLVPRRAHGHWEGQQPFAPTPNYETPGPLAVLTRATIRPAALPQFWQHVPAAHRCLRRAEGLRYAIGVGELPAVQQATFSLWDSEAAVRAFAYGDTAHRQIVGRARRQRWYREELFAQFWAVAASGAFVLLVQQPSEIAEGGGAAVAPPRTRGAA